MTRLCSEHLVSGSVPLEFMFPTPSLPSMPLVVSSHSGTEVSKQD